LRVEWEKLTAEDLMTPNPLEAKPWHSFGMVRDAMIANSFSHVPIWWKDEWRLISERTMCRLVQRARVKKCDLRSKRLDAAVALGGAKEIIADALIGQQTITVPPAKPATELALDSGCLLVVRDREYSAELVGIITAADVI